ncbi:hypothetical protein M9Y10_043312 [Tritrichomonas musculus]|uniref:Myb-like DNA-binding domain containing protein n=1 Tax=Tritrichomonas musculus TaxID=1915356 RepID=A0ABR2JZP6_9EUKA
MFLVVKPSLSNNENDLIKPQNQNTALLNSANTDVEIKTNMKNIRSRFTKEEDDRLKNIVESQKDRIDWNQISLLMDGRTPRQCRERYTNYLRPNLLNGAWTEEEDRILDKLYEKMGPQWSKIAQYFPNRSDVNIKNHHTCIVNRLYRQQKVKMASNAEGATNVSKDTENDMNNELNSSNEANNIGQNTSDSIISPIMPVEVIKEIRETTITDNIPTNPSIPPVESIIPAVPNIDSNISNNILTFSDISTQTIPTLTESTATNILNPANQTIFNNANTNSDSYTQAISNLAISRLSTPDITPNTQEPNKIDTNAILKNIFSLLVNLSLLISQQK